MGCTASKFNYNLNFIDSPVYKFGERGSGLRARGSVQDFTKLRDKCLEKNILFEDREFPALEESISYSGELPLAYEWKRPKEICEDPQFFIEGASRFDVLQGHLEDCWLLAALSNLTLNPVLFNRVVPPDQSFDKDYAGIFHFRFWQYGRWVDIVIDDRLPTHNGQLVFLHSQEKNEFWSALLEKAYAKLQGCYEALDLGRPSEAMEDFTGGLAELFKIQDEKDKGENLFNILLHAYERSSLMECHIKIDGNKMNEIKEPLENGLLPGHAYSITAVRRVKIDDPEISREALLLRLRNPWGNDVEWKGPWSDKSKDWQLISDEKKKELGLTFEADGEFWISFEDFMENFTTLEMCNLHPDSLDDETESKHKWKINIFEGCWIKGISAGGCLNNSDTFPLNPQYRIKIGELEEMDDEQKCTIVVALMQKNHRRHRKAGTPVPGIGFSIFFLENPEDFPKPLGKDFFSNAEMIEGLPEFTKSREVSARIKLRPGTYCIVPSTFEAGREGTFLLRVFSEIKNTMEEIDDDIRLHEIDIPTEDVVDSGTQINMQMPLDTEMESMINECFHKYAQEHLEIDAQKLKLILENEFRFHGLSKHTCRSLVAMMDLDMSGRLGFEEFKQLYINISNWTTIFEFYDTDSLRCLEVHHLKSAFASAGYHLNRRILRTLVLRYALDTGTISFNDFILCAIKFRTIIEAFNERDQNGNNQATFTLEELVEKTMYT